MTGYLSHGLLTADKDLAIILSDNPKPLQIEFETEYKDELLSTPKYFIHGDMCQYDQIEVQICELNHKFSENIIGDGKFGYFEIDVTINENEDPILEIKDRNYKLEDLSMELQARIVKVANEMYNDKMKTILND